MFVFPGGTVNFGGAVMGGYLDLQAAGVVSATATTTLGFPTINARGGSIMANSGTLTVLPYTDDNGDQVATINNVSGLTLGGAGDVVIQSRIVGAGALTKNGSGTVTLNFLTWVATTTPAERCSRAGPWRSRTRSSSRSPGG